MIDSGISSLNSTFATSQGQVTELAGLPGLGKTQLCIQLTASVLKTQGQVVYIDTEGSFSIQRLFQMAGTSINSSDLVVYRITSVPELLSLILDLDKILKDLDRIKLIIVDSIAFLFKGISDYNQRSIWLNSIGIELKKISFQKNILIVLTNQMTTKLQNATGVLVPALGKNLI
jgi:RecA/RadA recombinase